MRTFWPVLARTASSGVQLAGRGIRAPDAHWLAGEPGRDCERVGRRVRRQEHRRAWRLVEVEVFKQVAEYGCIFPHVGPRIGPGICRRVEPGAAEEVVLDELEVGVAAEDLMVDVALLRIRGDD